MLKVSGSRDEGKWKTHVATERFRLAGIIHKLNLMLMNTHKGVPCEITAFVR